MCSKSVNRLPNWSKIPLFFNQSNDTIYLTIQNLLLLFLAWFQDSFQIKGREYVFMSSIVCQHLAEVISSLSFSGSGQQNFESDLYENRGAGGGKELVWHQIYREKTITQVNLIWKASFKWPVCVSNKIGIKLTILKNILLQKMVAKSSKNICWLHLKTQYIFLLPLLPIILTLSITKSRCHCLQQ